MCIRDSTKSMFPGLRIGYMVLPPQLVAPMTAARTLQDGHSPSLSQLTLARFIEGGHLGAHVRTMRSLYAARRDILAELLDTQLSDFLIPRLPAGGMQMPCLFTRPMDERALVLAARAVGVDLLGMGSLYAQPRNDVGLLMGFAAHTPAELTAAVKRLKKVMGKMV